MKPRRAFSMVKANSAPLFEILVFIRFNGSGYPQVSLQSDGVL